MYILNISNIFIAYLGIIIYLIIFLHITNSWILNLSDLIFSWFRGEFCWHSTINYTDAYFFIFYTINLFYFYFYFFFLFQHIYKIPKDYYSLIFKKYNTLNVVNSNPLRKPCISLKFTYYVQIEIYKLLNIKIY